MKRLLSFFAAAALLLALAAPAAAQGTLAGRTILDDVGELDIPRGDLFISDLDSIWTASERGVLTNASILIQDGVITAIGRGIEAPEGVRVIDGTGYTAMPGIVDEHSHTAMDRGTNEFTSVVSAEVRVADALDADDYSIYQALSGGVTTALILHGSANPIGGESALIKMRWGMDSSRQLLFQGAPRYIKFALGENVTNKNWDAPGPERYPISREGVEQLYVQAFKAAKAYKQKWQDYRQNPEDYRVPPRRNLRLEALVDVLEGELRVHAHAYRADEMLMLMDIAERFGFQIDVFTHALEAYKIADELAANDVGASTFSDWWMYKLEAYDAIPYNAAITHRHGVLTSINSDIPWLQSFMVYEMNKPVKYGGLPKKVALRMLTLYPAKQLRVADKVGSLEVGKHGDVVLLSGSPFNTFSRVETTIVDGIVYYDRTRDEQTRGFPVREMPDVAEPLPEGATAQVAWEETGDARVRTIGLDPNAPVTALVGATVHPITSPPIQNGVVLIQGKKIVTVGPASAVEIPERAKRIDLSGKQLYPGMIDPLSQLGLIEIGSIPSARDDRTVGQYNPHIRGLTGVNPYSAAIPVVRANGITSVLTVPATGIVQGSGTVIQLKGDTPDEMLIESRAALVVDFPAPEGERWEEPTLEGEKIQELIDLFERAELYAARPTTVDEPTTPFAPNAHPSDAVLLEALVPAVTGEMPVIFKARTERRIRTLLMFLEKFPQIDAVLAEADQAFRVAEELAARDIPVIVESEFSPTMSKHDPIAAGWRNAAVLHEAGVEVAFTGKSVELMRNLPYHAARAVAYGLPRNVALQGLTITPARILGLADKMGSIEPGKRADLIVTDGDPLQITTNVQRMWIGGEEVSLESKHTRLREKFRDR